MCFVLRLTVSSKKFRMYAIIENAIRNKFLHNLMDCVCVIATIFVFGRFIFIF